MTEQATPLTSIVVHGDTSKLTPQERADYYMQMCEQLGLNPHSQPFAYLRLNGKEILYATRGATDQLAAIHRLNREIVDGPKLIDLAGTKLVFAVCRATHPNGRVETSTATVPPSDLVNALMKCETKAKRRATLSILGLGLLDEMELETIPAHAQEPGSQVDLGAATKSTTPEAGAEPPKGDMQPEAKRDEQPEAEVPPALDAFYSRVREIELPGEGVAVWLKHRSELGPLPPDQREAAWKALHGQVGRVGKMARADEWLKKAIAEEEARRGAAGEPSVGTHDTAPPSRAWAFFCAALPQLTSVRAVADLYSALQWDLQEEGIEPAEYVQDTAQGAGGGTLARQHIAALGHRCSSAELQELLVNPEMGAFLDGQTEVSTLPQAALWWRKHRAAAKALGATVGQGVFYALARRLAADLTPASTKKAVTALKDAVAAADRADGPKPPGGGGGAPAPSAPSNTSTVGASTPTAPAGSPAVAAFKEHLRTHKSPGGVAGSFWAHRDEFEDCEAEARGAVIDELERRNVRQPHTYLDAIGEKNGYLRRELEAA